MALPYSRLRLERKGADPALLSLLFAVGSLASLIDLPLAALGSVPILRDVASALRGFQITSARSIPLFAPEFIAVLIRVVCKITRNQNNRKCSGLRSACVEIQLPRHSWTARKSQGSG